MISWISVDDLLFILWISIMLIIPKEYGIIKGILLLMICFKSLTKILIVKSISKNECVYFLIFIIYYISSLLLGIMSGWKFDLYGDMPLVFYYIITPICVFLLGDLYADKKMVIFKTLVIITSIICVLDTIKLLMLLGVMPNSEIINIFIHLDSDNMLYNELTLRLSNESSLIFLIPLNIMILSSIKEFSKVYRLAILISVVFGCVYAMFSGRRILELGIIFSSFVFVFQQGIFRFSLKKFIKYSVVGIIFISIFSCMFQYINTMTGLIDIKEMIIQTFFEGFTGSGMKVREGYLPSLIDLWSESPLIGNGLNAYGDKIASGINAWSYEVVYLALLGQAGFLGVGILAIGILAVFCNYWNLYSASKNLLERNIYLSVSVASFVFIFAGFTNPQIYYVWFWVIFFIFSKKDEIM